jgi:hypothetical protein
MFKIEITNIRAEYSKEHASESLLFEVDGTEYRELVDVNGWHFEFSDRITDDSPRQSDDFNDDQVSEIHDALRIWVSRNEGGYESAAEEPEVAEVTHSLFRSNGICILLTPAAAKDLDVFNGDVDLKFGNGYTVTWTRMSDGKHEQFEFYPGPPEANDLGVCWAINNPEDAVLDAIRSRNEDREKEIAEAEAA